MQNKDSKIVLIFGVFDLLHPGHKYILNQAKKFGDILHICLATDEFVLEYKNKKPINTYTQREAKIRLDFPDIIIHKGDTKMGQWSVFKQIIPNTIVFGYDQLDLKNTIKDYFKDKNINYIVIPAYKPELYKTTLLS